MLSVLSVIPESFAGASCTAPVHDRKKRTGNTLFPVKKDIPFPVMGTGMEIIRGIPDNYLATACMVMAFLLFLAGSTAFDRSPFYGWIFCIIALVLFIAGIAIGRRYIHDYRG
jgi:hypothetical protein